MTTSQQPSDAVDATPVKKRGRPKNENYMSWEDARELVRAEMIPSRGKYFEWWERNKPKAIPRFPYRVYTDGWVSWNDFLGTDNKFNTNVAGKWRPYHEAVIWAHAQKIASYEAWMAFVKGGANLPDDIPARPDLTYNKWVSWGHWLGNKPADAVEAKIQAVQQTSIYYIIREHGAANNVLTYGVDPYGMTHLKERWERERFEVIKMYWYQADQQDTIKRIVDHFSVPYRGDDRQRITSNVWEIIWHLDSILSTVRN